MILLGVLSMLRAVVCEQIPPAKAFHSSLARSAANAVSCARSAARRVDLVPQNVSARSLCLCRRGAVRTERERSIRAVPRVIGLRVRRVGAVPCAVGHRPSVRVRVHAARLDA
jgi:hypothetical protein